MVDALGQRTEYDYDDYDRLIRTVFHDGTYKNIGYDLAGRKTSETDQAGKTTAFEYDSVGNLVKVIDAMGFETEYAYDEHNNRITQTDANEHTTTMAFDKQNRLISRTCHNGDQERFGYNANGSMVYKVSGNDSTSFFYDSRNRETFRWYSNSGHTVETKYTADSKKDSLIDHRGITDYNYNSVGRLEIVTNPDNTFIEYTYDSKGNKTDLVTPWGTTQYSYDSLNRMKTVISPNNEITEYFYNAVGNRDSISHANGTSVGYEYDNLNRLTKLTNYAPDASVISSFTYEMNNSGIRTSVTEVDGSRVDYNYDDLYRLTGETRTGANAYSITYTYDNVGNRLIKDHDGVETTYEYNNRDQVLSETNSSETITYTYDASGRTETKTDNSGVTTYGWADNDRMVSVILPSKTVTYTYDTDGNKVSMNDGVETKNYLVDMIQPYAQVIAEYENTNSLTAEYVYGLERISQGRTGTVHVFLADGQGSIRELTDGTGNVTDTYSYFAFGEILNRTGSTENEWTYTGEAFDPNLGFIYLRARWMNPENGRFVSVDPFEGINNLPFTLHRFFYANQSPLNFSDPSGEIVSFYEATAVFTVQNILANTALVVALASASNNLINRKPSEGYKTIGDEEDEDLAQIRIQFQVASELNYSGVESNDKSTGVTKNQAISLLYRLYYSLPTWWPGKIGRWTAKAVKKLEKKIQKVRYPGVGPGFQYFFNEETTYRNKNHRIDMENLRGQNLKH
jgi:RHS repeat-associated protein